jgi:hypothetical protein
MSILNSMLVITESTDRYHVPWDLGCGNKNTKLSLMERNFQS